MASFLRQLFIYMRVRKDYWLIPILLFVVLCSSLIVFSESSILAPFLYTLF